MEFHRYPQVIRHHCNGGRFGPPWGFTPTSTCSWVGHPVSGLWQRTLRPIQTRSRFASGTECLKLARYYNSPDRSTKSTPSARRPLTVCKHKVSGSLSLPSRGPFHLSLTVLLLYRSSGSILAWRVVPPASHGIPRAPRYSGSGYVHFIFDYVALTLFDWPSQTIRLTKLTDIAVHNPAHIATYGLASSDFARHYFRNLG